MSVDDVIAQIRRFAAGNKIPAARLAAMAKLHKNALRYFWRSDWNPKVDSEPTICDIKEERTHKATI